MHEILESEMKVMLQLIPAIVTFTKSVNFGPAIEKPLPKIPIRVCNESNPVSDKLDTIGVAVAL